MTTLSLSTIAHIRGNHKIWYTSVLDPNFAGDPPQWTGFLIRSPSRSPEEQVRNSEGSFGSSAEAAQGTHTDRLPVAAALAGMSTGVLLSSPICTSVAPQYRMWPL